MRNLFSIAITILLLSSAAGFAQDNKINIIDATPKDSLLLKPYSIDPLAPSKAAFYSAILPGLGQVYNKRYWKVPLVYGGMGLSYYYYSFNNDKYHEYRTAYKNRLAGRPVTGQLANLSNDILIRGQKFHQRNRDLSLLITVGLYVLNIVDANVDAHLKQFNVNDNLTFSPSLQQNQVDAKYTVGVSVNYKF